MTGSSASATTTAIAATTAATVAAATDESGDDRRGSADSNTMRAIVQGAYGGSETLSLERLPLPRPDRGEVLIEVRAAGLDRGTWHLMTGTPYLIRLLFGLTGPRQPVPGLDVAGVVVETGPDVTRFQPGDEVFGFARGSFAAYAVAEETKLATKPASVGFDAAAVVPVSASTALQALTSVGSLAAGQRVLVIGASGGVGSYAVQLAHLRGAEVTGVASSAKLDLVRSLGATRAIAYDADGGLATAIDGGDRWDLILDIGGRSPVRLLRRGLTEAGTLVLVGGEGGDRITGGLARQIGAALRSPFVSQKLRFFISQEHHRWLDPLAEHLAAGELVPAIDRRFPLDEVPTAMDELAAGRIGGKAAIIVAVDGSTDAPAD